MTTLTKKKKPRRIDFKFNLSIYMSFLKTYWPSTLLLMVFILLVQSSHVADKYLFKVIVDEGTAFTSGALAKSVFVEILITLAIVFAVLVVGRVIVKWFQIHFITRLNTRMMRDLKVKFFNHILGLSYNFHTSHRTGSMISKIIRGGSAIDRMNDVLLFNFMPLIFQIVIAGLSLIYFDYLSAIVILVVAVCFIAYSWFINKIQTPAKLRSNDLEDLEKADISDIFTNVESIKYFGKEKRIKNKYKSMAEKTKRAFRINWDYFRWFDSVQFLILGIGTFCIVLFPLLRFLDHEISIGTVVFIYTVYVNLMGPLFSFVWGVRGFYHSMANFQALFQYAKLENDVKDARFAKPVKVKHGDVEFKDVTFSYHKRKIFNKFNLIIPKNKKIALVGPSGSGKTTLVKLLYRLYDLQEGKILIDGKDISGLKQESLRSELSIVPQECVLFDDTIYNNIAFSNPKATRADVMKAMKFAQLDKIVKQFPNKENTIVGERGVKLSGGEKQRVSIARAILANKKILVLDEATSSLDSETEFGIQRDLKKLMKGRTTIIIAHRLSTIMEADFIVVLENGKMKQMNTHNELIKEEGLYKRLWHLQKGGYLK
jgi:ATP-binding cassette, subfamily B, heavy metal transporter